MQLDLHDANEPNVLEPQHLPDTEVLAEAFRGCLQVCAMRHQSSFVWILCLCWLCLLCSLKMLGWLLYHARDSHLITVHKSEMHTFE